MDFIRIRLIPRLVAVAVSVGYVALGSTSLVGAQTATTNMSVTASVVNNCSISSPAALAFGAYDPIGVNSSANLDASPLALAVKCTRGAVATIGLDTGANAQGTTRRMKSGTNFLTYEIYTTTARTTVWNTTNTVTYTAATSAQTNMAVFGRIPSGQDVPSGGSYTDTIVATINF
jgi:spore coat protein U-like protein